MGELLGLYHVRFPTDVSPALDAPTTEIAVWALAPGTDRAAGRAAAVEVVRMIHEDMQEDVLGGALGDIVEDERRVSVILGWHSVEVCPCSSERSGVRLRFLCSGSMQRFSATKGVRRVWRNSRSRERWRPSSPTSRSSRRTNVF